MPCYLGRLPEYARLTWLDIAELPKKLVCIWGVCGVGNAEDHKKPLMLNQSQCEGHCNDLADLIEGYVNLNDLLPARQ